MTKNSFDPMTIRGSQYRINVGTIQQIQEKTGLNFFSQDLDKSPLGNPVNAVRAIEAIALPPINLSDLAGDELVEVYDNFVEECNRFFPVAVQRGAEPPSPTVSPTTPSAP